MHYEKYFLLPQCCQMSPVAEASTYMFNGYKFSFFCQKFHLGPWVMVRFNRFSLVFVVKDPNKSRDISYRKSNLSPCMGTDMGKDMVN